MYFTLLVFMNFLISSPAKAILFGEHAVVYGQVIESNQPCVATSVDKRSFCYVTDNTTGLSLFCPDIDLDYRNEYIEGQPALDAFLQLSNLLNVKHAAVMVRSEIPVGAGLGSSASYSVCISAALLLLSKRFTIDQLDLDLINQYALEAEKIIHGNPSGVDNAISTFGGANLYIKNQPLEPITKFKQLPFLVIDTMIPKNTKFQVEQFRLRLNEFPSMEDIVHAIGNVSKSCVRLFDRDSVDQIKVFPF
jgi:mevalonate kinase